MSEVFPTQFVSAISSLRLVPRRFAAGGLHGEHRTAHAGPSVEFRDYRSYTAGDDLRHVDWNIFRRTGALFMRRHERFESVPLHILVDASESMFLESPPRILTAQRVAAAYAAAALRQQDGVVLYPFGAELGRPSAVFRGRGALPDALEFLEGLRPMGRTGFRAVVRSFARVARRGGIAVVVSDFFDDRGVDELIGALQELRQPLSLVRLTNAADAEPVIRGDWELVDCESAASLAIQCGATVLEQYRRAYQGFVSTLKAFADRSDVPYREFGADEGMLTQLARAFPDGVIAV